MEENLNCPNCGRYSDCEENCISRRLSLVLEEGPALTEQEKKELHEEDMRADAEMSAKAEREDDYFMDIANDR